MEDIAKKLGQIRAIKQEIKTALKRKGRPMQNVPFAQYPNEIMNISHVLIGINGAYELDAQYEEVIEQGDLVKIYQLQKLGILGYSYPYRISLDRFATAYENDELYIQIGYKVYAFNRFTGEFLYTVDFGTNPNSNLISHGYYLYTCGSRNLRKLDKTTGYWIEVYLGSNSSRGELAIKEGRLYVIRNDCISIRDLDTLVSIDQYPFTVPGEFYDAVMDNNLVYVLYEQEGMARTMVYNLDTLEVICETLPIPVYGDARAESAIFLDEDYLYEVIKSTDNNCIRKINLQTFEIEQIKQLPNEISNAVMVHEYIYVGVRQDTDKKVHIINKGTLNLAFELILDDYVSNPNLHILAADDSQLYIIISKYESPGLDHLGAIYNIFRGNNLPVYKINNNNMLNSLDAFAVGVAQETGSKGDIRKVKIIMQRGDDPIGQ